MSGEFNEYRLYLPKERAERRLEILKATAAELGGLVTDLLDELPAERSAHEPRINIQSDAEFEYLTDQTFPFISSNQWDYFAITKQGISKSWATRGWNDSRSFVSLEDRDVESDLLNMSSIRRAVRRVEAGDRQLFGLGKTAWNALANLNNWFTLYPEGYILPWDEEVHPILRHRGESRQSAAEQLAGLYRRFIGE